jgi:hypothetical protein
MDCLNRLFGLTGWYSNIELLKEKKEKCTALITAGVTGKIDVRE